MRAQDFALIDFSIFEAFCGADGDDGGFYYLTHTDCTAPGTPCCGVEAPTSAFCVLPVIRHLPCTRQPDHPGHHVSVDPLHMRVVARWSRRSGEL
jgi:hypothetical protein